MNRAILPIALGFSFLLMGFMPPKDTDTFVEFRPHMQSVYASLIPAINILLKGDAGMTAKERTAMEVHFKNLAENGTAIEVLSRKSDKSHQVLASQLASDAKAAYFHFKAGNSAQTRYFLSDVVNTCFNCHTSRGSSQDSRFVIDFNKDMKWESFEPLAKARFMALSRQFEAASKEYEALLLSDRLSLDEIINLDPLLEYMIIGIRVQDDPGRVLKALQAMDLQNSPELLKKDMRAWITTLKEQQTMKGGGNELSQAKSHMLQAKEIIEYPQDRAGIVHYIFASRLLHDFIRLKEISTKDKAEAYYIMGLCEVILGTNLFEGEAMALFEEAIRLLPRSDMARKAFAQYEELIRFGYSGSSGMNLPDEEKEKLERLRRLAY